jgi:hypothetical protein
MEISSFLRGNLKSGPDKKYTVKALEMNSYRLFLALYLMALAIFVLLNASDAITDIFMSPFGLWLVFFPIIVGAIGFEFPQARSSEEL